jgi:hypothetical protein
MFPQSLGPDRSRANMVYSLVQPLLSPDSDGHDSNCIILIVLFDREPKLDIRAWWMWEVSSSELHLDGNSRTKTPAITHS